MEELYSKEDFSDDDGDFVGKLQSQYEEIGGWNAESNAANLLSNIYIKESLHHLKMEDLDGKQKVRVLLAQSLFGNPDIQIMDEPTNDLDYDTIMWLENFLANYDSTYLSLASLLKGTYPVTEESKKYRTRKNYFPLDLSALCNIQTNYNLFL